MRNRFKRNRNLGYLPIGYKMMLTYMVFIIIPVTVIGLVSNSMYENSIRKQTKMNLQGTLFQIRDNIEYKLLDMKRITSLIYLDHSLISQLRSYEEGWDNYDRTIKMIIPKIEVATTATSLDLWMSVFFHNESIPEVYRTTFERENPDITLFDMYNIKRIKDKDWYLSFPSEKFAQTMEWKQIEKDRVNGRISLLRRIVDFTDPTDLREIGFMRLNVHLDELFQSIDYNKIGTGSVIYIQDDNGHIMYQSGTFPAGMDIASRDASYLSIKEELTKPEWELVAFVPTDIMEQDSFKVKMLIILMCILCMVVFTFAGLFVSRYFSIRIMKFVSVLNAFREGDLHKRIKYRGKDEFSQIAVALNEMGENIGDLIKEVYLTQLQKKEAELETLQSQINPHFLYNTLSSISRLAKFGETDKLQHMVMELAKFYRLTLNEGRTMIPVHSEIEQANAYLNIQKVKYMDRMDVMWDIDPEVWPYETVKLIVQPFLENVLEHAWCGDRIHIRIVGRLEGNQIRFRIIDDGVGMRAERIAQIFDPRDHVNAGYGIRNVNQRIQLQYGEQYGVQIFSRLGIGTSVDIVIPAIRYQLR